GAAGGRPGLGARVPGSEAGPAPVRNSSARWTAARRAPVIRGAPSAGTRACARSSVLLRGVGWWAWPGTARRGPGFRGRVAALPQQPAGYHDHRTPRHPGAVRSIWTASRWMPGSPACCRGRVRTRWPAAGSRSWKSSGTVVVGRGCARGYSVRVTRDALDRPAGQRVFGRSAGQTDPRFDPLRTGQVSLFIGPDPIGSIRMPVHDEAEGEISRLSVTAAPSGVWNSSCQPAGVLPNRDATAPQVRGVGDTPDLGARGSPEHSA